MLKKLLFSSFVLLSSVAYGQQGNTVTLSDVVFSVDTLFHAQVGPGTTQTSLHLTNTATPSQQLRVFYFTVDLTNPVVGIEAVVGKDRLSGGETVSSMASRHSSDTRLFYAGINTDFFLTSGNATNGVSMVGTPTNASIAGGEIFRTGGTSTAWPTFFMDADGVPNI